MSTRELKKHHFIRQAVDGKMSVAEAAEELKLSCRRIKQLKKAYKEIGPEACIHGNARRPSPKRTKPELVAKILDLRQNEILAQSNYTHFRELIHEHHGIDISLSTLRRVLNANGYKSPMRKRPKKPLHKTRERKPAFGMMLQADASPFDWLGTGQNASLHGFIDDATGTITGLYLCKNECLLGYLEAMRQTLTDYGIPQSSYSDRSSIFFVNPKQEDKLSIHEQLEGQEIRLTQFGRIMQRLGVEMIKAYSPEAKGRVERLWCTLQSRLSVEFRLRNIKTLDDANAFLKTYIPRFNEQFAVEPAAAYSAFVPVPHTENLDNLLAVVFQRKLCSGSTISIKNIRFRIEQNKFYSGTPVTVLLSEKHGLRALISGEFYPIVPLDPITHAADVVRTGQLPYVTIELIQEFLMRDAKAA